MALNQRRIKILELIREDGHAKVQQLSKIFGVTEVTIRQDLEMLDQLGYIQREHGGAFLKDVGSFAKTGKLFNQTRMDEKREIARKAVAFIHENDIIILDSGSTTTEIAKLLLNYKNLTVITNALNIALILGENPGINLVVTGGEFKAPTLSLTGQIESSDQVFLVADSSKIGVSAFASLGPVTLANFFITDSMITEEQLEKMKESGINILLE